MRGDNKRGLIRFTAGLILFTLIFAAASFLCVAAVKKYFEGDGEGVFPSASVGEEERFVIVLDPGHGGEDGGCTEGGVLEKDLNLDVALRLRELCRVFGVPCEMTREDDRLLYDLYGELEDYGGKMKTYDLKNRVRFAEEREGAVYVGIHMNSFPEAKYRGLQVWYSPNAEESRAIAEKVQSGARSLDSSNKREAKRAGKSIFVLDRLTVPAVLVECGFLSNPEEREALCGAEYQMKIASLIFSSVVSFENGEPY